MASRVHYRVITVDLSQATSAPKEVFGRDLEVSDVGVIELPAAAVGQVKLHLGGPNADGIKLRLEGQNFHCETEPKADGSREGLVGGVFVTHGALGAITMELLIGLTVRVGD